MLSVPKNAFPFFWSKKKPPTTLYLKSECEGCFGELYTLTSLPSLNGMVLTLEDSDEVNAYYNVSARPDYISEFQEKYHLANITYYNSHLFKITWFGDNPPLGI